MGDRTPQQRTLRRLTTNFSKREGSTGSPPFLPWGPFNMPLYDYVNPTNGELMELYRPMEDRDKPILKNGIIWPRFSRVPRRIAVLNTGPSPDQTFNAQVRKGYYDREQKLGSRFRDKREGLTKKQLADLWSDTGK